MIKTIFFCFLYFSFIYSGIAQDKIKLIVSCDNNFPPYEFIDKDGMATGFNIDLINEISKEMGFDIEIKSGIWSDIKKEFDEKKIDIVSGLIYSIERDKYYDFSVPHSIINFSIFTRKNSSDIKTETDLINKSIVTQKNGFIYDYFKSKKYNIIGVPNPEECLKTVSSEKYDCTVGIKYTNLYIIKKIKLKNITISGNLFESQKLCFAVLNENNKLLSKINEGLFIIKNNGKFQILYDKWFGVLEPNNISFTNAVKYIYIIIAVFILLAILAFLWLFSLKRQVNLRTKELQNELTVRKKIEQALLESESMFTTIFKKFPNPVSINTITGEYIDVNEYFEEYSGFKKEETIGKTSIELGIFDSESYRNEYISKLNEKGEIRNYELNLFTKNKQIVTGLTSSVIVKNKGENIVFTAFNDITERKELEQALCENEEKFRMMFDDSPLGIFQTGYDEKIIFINNSYARILGYDSIEDAKKNLDYNLSSIYVEQNKRNEIIALINNTSNGKIIVECDIYKKDKSIITVMAFFKKVFDEKNNSFFLEGFIEDITSRKSNELRLRDSLHEKEILLKEIHHRVKNNLQIISSLLNLQQNYLKNKEDAKIFQDSQNRVKSMAIIHEKLYESKDISQVDLNDYVSSLAHYLYLSYGVENSRIQLDLNIEKLFFEIEKAISFGILLNELISNCFKHAFPDEKEGKISISLKKDNENNIVLIVKDNGIGLPDNFKIEDTNSLGLKLVSNLCIQLNGNYNVENNNGVEFKVIFKE